MRWWHYTELIGLVLVVLSTAAGLFFLDVIDDIAHGGDLYRVEQKMNAIALLVDDIAESKGNVSDAELQAFDRAYFETFDYYERVNTQAEIARSIVGWVFVLGSVLTIFGRWAELQDSRTRG